MSVNSPSGTHRSGAWSGLLLVLLAGIIWGTIGPSVQMAHDHSGLSPWTISSYRAAVALVVLIAAVMFTRRLRSISRRARPHWPRLIVVGVLTSMFQFLFFVAVLWAGVSVATVVALGSAPVILLILGSITRRRLPSLAQVITLALAITGLLLISLVGGGVADPPHPVLGTLAALGAGTAYGFSAEAVSPLTLRLDLFTVTVTTLTIASLILIPTGLLLTALNSEPLFTTDVAAWGWIINLGVLTMVVAYALFYAGLRTVPSGAAVLGTLIEPVATVTIAVLFLGERLTLPGFVGGLCILVAIASLSRQGPRPAPPPQ